MRAPAGHRIAGLLVSAIALTVLVIAASLEPDPRGVETHTQLGLWPCGWYQATGVPCPTCGMTTSFAQMTHRRLLQGFLTQPFGAILAVATAVAFWGGLHVAAFGSQLGALGGGLLRPRWVILSAGLLLVSWAYKIAVMRGW